MSLLRVDPAGREERRPPAPDDDRRAFRIAAVAVTGLAAVTCLWSIGAKGLWFDEGFSVGLVRRPFGDFLWRAVHWEVNQSPFYLLLYPWRWLGESEGLLRLLPALMAIATVPVVLALGRRLFDLRVGVVAAVLTAANGLVVQQAQTVRGYPLVLLLVSTSTLLLVRAVDAPSRGRVVAYALVSALSVYAHFFAVLVLAAHAASLLALRPFPRRLATNAAVVTGLALVPFAVFFLTREGDPLAWVPAPSGLEPARVYGRLVGAGPLRFAVFGLAVLAGLAVVATTLRRSGDARDRWRHLLVGAWLVVPLGFATVSSYTAKPLLVAKFLIVVVPAIALLAAVGLTRLADRRASVALTALVALVGLSGCIEWYRQPTVEDWRGQTAALVAEARPGDAVMVFPREARPTVSYYYRRLDRPLPPFVLPPRGDDPTDAARLWVLGRTRAVERNLDVTDRELEAWLAGRYELVRPPDDEGTITLSLYERRG